MTPINAKEDIARATQELSRVAQELKSTTDPIKRAELAEAKHKLLRLITDIKTHIATQRPTAAAVRRPTVTEAYVSAMNSLHANMRTIQTRLSNFHLTEAAADGQDFVAALDAVNKDLRQIISRLK